MRWGVASLLIALAACTQAGPDKDPKGLARDVILAVVKATDSSALDEIVTFCILEAARASEVRTLATPARIKVTAAQVALVKDIKQRGAVTRCVSKNSVR